jgi:hypothetical protein
MGATTVTAGKAINQLTGQAVSHRCNTSLARPTARNVATPVIMKDIIPDRKKLKVRCAKRAGIMAGFRMLV